MTGFFVAVLLAICIALAAAAWKVWLNPVSIVLLAWLPPLVGATAGVQFTQASYAVLNSGVAIQAYLYLFLALASLSAGALLTHLILGTRVEWGGASARAFVAPRRDTSWLLFAFLAAAGLFAILLSRSGLYGALSGGLGSPDAESVFESRLAFHQGFVNHFVLLLDVTAVVFFSRYLESGKRWMLLPPVVAMLGYLATLQKSRVLFIVLGCLFVALIYPKEARKALFGTLARSLVVAVLLVAVFAGLIVANMLRGIGTSQYTDIEQPLLEQLFIYSGGPAVLNFSATVDGALPSDPPTYGALLARPVLWPFVDRDWLNPTRYLEGINNGTSLIFYWWDLRALGVLLIPALVGTLASLAFWFARGRSIVGLTFGALAFNALVMSPITDVMFEPTTWIMIGLATGLQGLSTIRFRLGSDADTSRADVSAGTS